MTDPPRLLIVVHERPGMREAIARELPGVPFRFLAEVDRAEVGSVEAALLGSMGRDATRWEPSEFPRLRFVQRAFTGVDDLPFDRLPPGVEVAGNVGAYAPFVAEHALALALASGRCLLLGSAAVAAGRSRPPPELRTLRGETAVVLGYGEIGRALSERLRSFGAEVVGLNRTGTPAPGAARMFPADRLREALGAGGIVFDARPLTTLTLGSIGAAELAAMREEATLVNVGRGATVDQEALFRHLESHPRFRAALDVWWDEDFAEGRLTMRFPFPSLPNFVGTPHWAGFAPGVQEVALGRALENLRRFFAGDRPRYVVDRAEYAGLRRGGGP